MIHNFLSIRLHAPNARPNPSTLAIDVQPADHHATPPGRAARVSELWGNGEVDAELVAVDVLRLLLWGGVMFE